MMSMCIPLKSVELTDRLLCVGPGNAPTLDRRETENTVAYFMMFVIFSKDLWKPGPNSSFYLSHLIENQIEK